MSNMVKADVFFKLLGDWSDTGLASVLESRLIEAMLEASKNGSKILPDLKSRKMFASRKGFYDVSAHQANVLLKILNTDKILADKARFERFALAFSTLSQCCGWFEENRISVFMSQSFRQDMGLLCEAIIFAQEPQSPVYFFPFKVGQQKVMPGHRYLTKEEISRLPISQNFARKLPPEFIHCGDAIEFNEIRPGNTFYIPQVKV